MQNTLRSLIQAARKAKRHAHVPYSKFRVGAALLTAEGTIVTGCNVESSSYGLTICAERTAVFKAVSDGKKRFKAIAITSTDQERRHRAGPADRFCGIWRETSPWFSRQREVNPSL